MKINVAAVQLNSVLGNVEENMTKTLRILEQAFPSNKAKPDLIVLPELALTGYNFKSPTHISPYLEKLGCGKSYEFGKLLSKRWNCLTLLGYPEKHDSGNLHKIYNSAVLIDSKGEIVHNYRKTHLFETDKVWGCSESPTGFKAFDLQIKGENVRTTIGICMDLNPYEFKAPFEKYEFATFAADQKCQLILVPTAWMNSNWDENWTSQQINEFKKIYDNSKSLYELNTKHQAGKDNAILYLPKETKRAVDYKLENVDGSTGKYWVIRMYPLYSKPHPNLKQCVVVCNRSGMEDKLMYAGTSTMYTFHGGVMEKSNEGVSIDFSIEGSLGQGTEGVLVRELEIET
jgi:protein N-terminal amidase